MDYIPAFSLVMIALLAFKLRSFKLFDELMAMVHGQHPDRWEELGQPIGYFWRPETPDVRTLPSMAARRKLSKAWLSEVPDWMPEGGPERVKLAAWRFTFWGSWLGIAGVGLALVALQLLT